MFGDGGSRLTSLVAALLALLVGVLVWLSVRQPAPAPNAIALENQQPGSDTWRLPQPGHQIADDANGQIKGYASATSANKGSRLTLYVSAAPAQAATIEIYRMGWYGGKGGRLLLRIGPLDVAEQPACPSEPLTGMIACDWAPTVTFDVPDEWTSGAYLAVLTNADNFQNYVPFVVRDDAHTGGLLYKQPVNTYQAYNNYPDDQARGKSLYDFNSNGLDTLGRTPRAVKVSFDRPYAQNGAGDFLKWEYNLIRWLERSGYDLTYITDVDYDAWPGRAFRELAVLSAGHDEYWTKRAYDGFIRARDGGVHLAFFASNAIYWQARYEPSLGGQPSRVLVCWREDRLDPIDDPARKTVLWRGTPGRPEQALIGVSYSSLLASNVPFIVTNSDNWVYAGTDLRDGDQIRGIVGYETDSQTAGLPTPEHRPGTYQILSSSPVQDTSGSTAVSSASIYQAESGAWVFASGTTSWSWALDADGFFDSRIERATANVVDTFARTITRPAQPARRGGLYSEAVLRDAPVAYWKPAEQADWHVADVTGNHYDGLLSGGVSVEDSGAIVSERDTALLSDGTAKVSVRELPPLVDFTIEGWTSLTDSSWNSGVLYNNALYGSVPRVRLLIRPGGSVSSTHGYFGVWLDGTEYVLQPSSLGVSNTDGWVHWALTRQANILTVYRDGVPIAERADLPPTASANVTGTLFRQTEAFPLKGGLDDVAIYDRALSAATVRERVDLARRPPTLPVIAPTVTGQVGTNGWYLSDVTLDWQYETGGFEVESVTGCQPAGLRQESMGEVHTCSVTTIGGTSTSTVTLKRDSTPPVVSALRVPVEPPTGWNNAPVTVSFECRDDLSGVADCPPPIVVDTDGANQVVSALARDQAGNAVNASVDRINIDRTPPAVVGTAHSAPNPNGWYTGDVTIDWTADDALSGVDAQPQSSVVTGEGAQLRAQTSVADRAGNIAVASSAAVAIDRSPPSILFTGNRGTYTVDQPVAIACTVLDAVSGPETPVCDGANGPAYAFGLGTTNLTASGADLAGNARTSSTSFVVQVTNESLCTLSRRFSLSDAVGRSLCGRLSEAALASGATRAEALGAYVREVDEQAGQALLREQATLLNSLARALYP